jgi:cytochrome c553
MTAMIRVSVLALTLLAAPLTWSKGSAEAGATKAATCLACHGANGNSVNPEWPSLAGQNAAYISAQLRYYHNGRRVGRPGDANAALMPPMAAALTSQDIEDLAAYYSLQTPTGLETDAGGNFEAGRKLYNGGATDPGLRRLPRSAGEW